MSKEVKLGIPSPIPNYESKFLTVGGDNNTDQYTCLTNDNLDIGTWATVSDVYNNFTMFSALTTGASFYIGNPTNTMAFRINIVTPTSQSSNLVVEYWNGTAWTSVTTMSLLASKPFYSYGNTLFGRAQSETVYLGLTTGWVQNTVNSISNYWFRIRIASTLSSNIQANMLVRNLPALEIDIAGYVHQSGLVTSTLPLAFRSTNAPAANVFAGSFPMTGLSFSKATNASANTCINILRGADTSKPVNLYFGMFSATAGNAKFQISTMPITIGGGIFSTAQSVPATETDTTIVVANTPNTYVSSVVSLPISNMILKKTDGTTDALGICVTRLSNDIQDTINDAVIIFQSALSFFAVNLGLQSAFY